MTKAILLLSGGLDSSTCFLIARAEGFEIHALSFDYGQRHAVELSAPGPSPPATGPPRIASCGSTSPAAAASALTNPRSRCRTGLLGKDPIPITYVPARNTLFLANAVALGEALGAFDVFIGANALDYSGYPDCRPEFLEAFERTANLGTRAGVEGARFRIHAPLLRMGKPDIVDGPSSSASISHDVFLLRPRPAAPRAARATPAFCGRKASRKQGSSILSAVSS